ncbi:MAG: DUF4097 family beta strand repeat-containing protein [Anaerolineae bacterium]
MAEENRSRNGMVWVFVAIVIVLMCGCVVAVAAGVGGWFLTLRANREPISFGSSQERTEYGFEVGRSPELEVDNFAGSVTVQGGQEGTIGVVAIKQASSLQNRQRIQVDVSRQGNTVQVRTQVPSPLSNANVRLEITVPAETRLNLDTGAGSIEVRGIRQSVKVHTGAGSLSLYDVTGSIDADTGAGSVTLTSVQGEITAHSGAGSIDVRDATGRALLDTGTGSIDYQGTPQGECRFESGMGSIDLRLPATLNMDVDLESGMGTVSVEYEVAGQVSRQEVKGTIGHGGDGSIYARTGTGSIDLIRR